MICSHCGAENKEDALKCVQCGANLKTAADKTVKKKSSAASRIRKISVERADSRRSFGPKKVSENTLQDLTDLNTQISDNEKDTALEDTLDLSNFHFENLELKETNLDDTDLLDADNMSDDGVGRLEKTDTSYGHRNHKGPKKSGILRWIILGAVLLAVIIAAAVLIYIWKNPKKDYADIILDGNRYYTEANYGKAKEAYNEALELNPQGAEGYFGLADVYAALNDVDKAVDILTQGYEQTGNEQFMERINELTGNIQESQSNEIPGDSGQSESNSDSGQQSVSDSSAVPANASNVIVWAVDPLIEADTIMPVLGCSSEDDIYSCNVSMIVQDGLAGLVDNNGQIVAQPQFTYILLCSGQLYAGMTDGTTHLLNSDYTVNEESAHNHSIVTYDYLWDDGKKAVYRIVHDSEGTRVEEEPFVLGQNIMIPVISGTSKDYSLENAVYGLAGSEGLCTDFIYENTGKVSRDGMIAVCRDGKWGFCNSSGDEIVPCEYDGTAYISADSSDKVSYVNGAPYDYSEGFAALKKDGVWGFLDKSGNIAVPFVFEEARPVYGEKAWVKYQGKWGIISITGSEEAKTDAVSDDAAQSETDS